MIYKLPIRVYYEDTDAGGVVYYANYLKFAERGRSEFLRALGFENKALMEQEEILFVVGHLEADYLASARLDDMLTLETAVSETGNASFSMKQRVFCGEKLLFVMTVKLVCVNLQGRPVRLPAKLKEVLDDRKNG